MNFKRVYPGDVVITDTERACEVEQRDEFSKLISLKPAIAKNDGQEKNVNVATFNDDVDIQDILDNLKFVDVSTAQGVADAATTFHTHTFMFDCKIFIKDKQTDIKVFGKKS